MLLSMTRNVLCFPVWGLWKVYNGLWWAFADDAAPAVKPGQGPLGPRTAAAAQNTAFEVVDSKPGVPPARPVGTLKGGFITTLASSAVAGWGTWLLHDSGQLQSATAVSLWAWLTAFVCVVSLWGVKVIARRQAAIKASTWREHARAACAGFGDMGRTVANAAVTTKNATVGAAQYAASGYRVSRDGVRKAYQRVRPS